MTMQGADQIELQTIRLDKVPRFDELFDLYRAEHAYTVPPRWDVSILDAKDYGDFNYRYMSELVRLRLLNDDWRCEMRELVKSPLTGADLLVLSQLRTSVTLGELQNTGDRAQLTPAFFGCLFVAGGPTASNPAFAGDMADATARAQALAQANGMQLADFAKWKALDMAGDFVRLANAGDLAYADIPAQRANQYKLLAQALSQTNASMQMNGDRVSDANTPADMFKARFKPLMAIMLKLADGLPSEHIRLDLKTNSLVNLSTTPSPF